MLRTASAYSPRWSSRKLKWLQRFGVWPDTSPSRWVRPSHEDETGRSRRSGSGRSGRPRPRAAQACHPAQLPSDRPRAFLAGEHRSRLRQYIVAGNDEERPFSRDQRRWVYASAKLQNNYFGFGTDNDLEHTDGNVIVHHRTFGRAYPTHGSVGQEARLPSAKILGSSRARRGAFRPESVVNVSGMSFGSLSGNAVEAINRGAAEAGCLHNTGEGAVSSYHRNGADLVFQIGTAYFGCRDDEGRFSLSKPGTSCRAPGSGRSRSSSARVRSPGWAGCSLDPRSPARSPRPVASPRGSTASAPPGIPSSMTSTPCSTSWSCSLTRPVFPSASSQRSATWPSGANSPP